MEEGGGLAGTKTDRFFVRSGWQERGGLSPGPVGKKKGKEADESEEQETIEDGAGRNGS